MVTANWMRDNRHTSMGGPLAAAVSPAAIIAETVPPCGVTYGMAEGVRSLKDVGLLTPLPAATAAPHRK